MNNKELALETIKELVTRFEEHLPALKSGKYKEHNLRQEFLNPFWEALGWDMNNKQGRTQSYKEVEQEDTLRIENLRGAPDYCFQKSKEKRFFYLEAKKPIENIKENNDHALQTRTYGWNGNLSISILSDFEEFSLYDCTKKPKQTDTVRTARLEYMTYKDYEKNFDFIWDTFSRDAVFNGSIDQFASKKIKRGKDTVDKEFLISLDLWRTQLAENISLRNKNNIDEDQLNFAVQHIIDRLIFLRIAEDRNIEPYGNLKNQLAGDNFYQNIQHVFSNANDRYNSGLFDPSKDKITAALSIDNKVIKDIVSDMYYPKSPYLFDVISVEILGSAYEQFLGKVITITDKGKAKIELKPEVRKAGGVYYTPQYIVDYIVENTVGKLLENKTTTEASELKICDPACGSGSFLLGAYQYLLHWHKDYYLAHPHKKNPLTPDGNLTTAEKKRILLNNIYGVDIDSNAVEVTKLSLLLKCMEGETQASIAHQMTMFNERVLPTLDDNIKSGNSLIDTDFYDGMIEFEERKIKPFNWQKAFPTVFKNGGFDVVIGNPPYVKIQTLQENNPKEIFDYFKNKNESAKSGNYDLYVIFIEKGHNLLNENGILGYIQPHKFFQSEFGDGIRNFIARKKALKEVVNFGANQIFDGATTYTCLLFLNKSENKNFKVIEVSKPLDWSIDKSNKIEFSLEQPIHNSKWNFANKSKQGLIDKLNSQPKKLADITRKIFVGLQTSADKIYVLEIKEWKKNTILAYSKSLEKNVELELGIVKPFLMGKDVKRYKESQVKNIVIFPYKIENGKAILFDTKEVQNLFPLCWEYLADNKKELENRENGKMRNEKFYAYIYPKNLAEFEVPKIMTPEIADKCQFTFDTNNLYHTTKVYSIAFNSDIKESELYYLGLLNSKILWYFLSNTGTVFSGGFFTFKTQFLNPFPVKTIDFSNKSEVVYHNEIVNFVEQLLMLNKDLQAETLESKKEQIKRKIDHFEDKINELVYKLYDLTEEEIKIVENN